MQPILLREHIILLQSTNWAASLLPLILLLNQLLFPYPFRLPMCHALAAQMVQPALMLAEEPELFCIAGAIRNLLHAIPIYQPELT